MSLYVNDKIVKQTSVFDQRVIEWIFDQPTNSSQKPEVELVLLPKKRKLTIDYQTEELQLVVRGGANQPIGSSSDALVNYRSNYPSSVDTGIVRIYSPQLPFQRGVVHTNAMNYHQRILNSESNDSIKDELKSQQQSTQIDHNNYTSSKNREDYQLHID